MITVDVSGKEEVTVLGIWRYDYRVTIEIIDNTLEIPNHTEIDFYQGDNGIVRYIQERRVNIPDIFLLNPLEILAYVYIRSPSSGETVKKIRLPIKNRPQPSNMELPDEEGEYLRLLPAGGQEGQVLTKKSEKDYDAEWRTVESGGTEQEAISEELIDKLFQEKGR